MPNPTSIEEQYADKVKVLLKLCEDYKKHLDKAASTRKPDETIKAKLGVVTSMIETLKSTSYATDELKLRNVKVFLMATDNKDTLKHRRDSSRSARFFESVMHVLSGGAISKSTKGTFKFWKSHGESLADKAEKVLKDVDNTPKY